jgi:hypothetical protein
MRTPAIAAMLLFSGAIATAGAAAGVRPASTADNAERSRGAQSTEWWFTGVIDPVSGEAFAASLGTRMAGGPPATAVLSLPPAGGERTLGLLGLGATASRSTVDVRVGTSTLREVAPGHKVACILESASA